MPNFLRFKWQGHKPHVGSEQLGLYVDDEGVLQRVDENGTVVIVGGGDLPDPTDDHDVLTVVEGSWQGAPPEVVSQPTDTIIEFTETAGDGPLLPITGLDQGAGTVTFSGDYTRFFIPGVGGGAHFAIVGSTGNDGGYDATVSVYDSDADETTITVLQGAFSDGTVNGNVQASALYELSFVLPPNSAVEWVLAVTENSWTADPAYLWVGDENDISAFSQATGINEAGTFQWPLKTVTTDETAFQMIGTQLTLVDYPDGATITVAVNAFGGGTSGTTTVTVHHHVTETTAAARIG